jgi:hypothetical protein
MRDGSGRMSHLLILGDLQEKFDASDRARARDAPNFAGKEGVDGSVASGSNSAGFATISPAYSSVTP